MAEGVQYPTGEETEEDEPNDALAALKAAQARLDKEIEGK